MEVLELVPQNLIDFVIKKNSEWFNTSVRWTDSQKFHHLFCLLLRDPTLKSKMNSLIMTGYNPYKIMLFTLWLVNLYYNIQKHTRENSDIDNKKRVNEINSFVKDNCTTDEALLISILISTYTPAKLSRNLDDVIVKPNQEKTHKSKSSKDATTSHLYRGKDHAILFDILNDVIILNTISVDNFNKEIQEFINNLPIQTKTYKRTESKNHCLNYYLRIKDRKIKTVMGKILAQPSHDYIEDYVRSQKHLLDYSTVSFIKK